jgi:hypothetical protein
VPGDNGDIVMEQENRRKSDCPGSPQAAIRLPRNRPGIRRIQPVQIGKVISLWLCDAEGFRGETIMQMNQKKTRPQVAGNPGPATAGRRLRAILCLPALAMICLPLAIVQPAADAAVQKLARSNRQVRITAASIARLPANKPYVIDLKQKGVAYDFDLSGGRINYSRVVVRTAAGDLPIATYLARKFREAGIKGWETRRVQLTVLATRGPAKGGLGLKSPTGPSPFTCNPVWCACQGDDDCNDMFTTNVCGDTAFCVNTSSSSVKCYCERP